MGCHSYRIPTYVNTPAKFPRKGSMSQISTSAKSNETTHSAPRDKGSFRKHSGARLTTSPMINRSQVEEGLLKRCCKKDMCSRHRNKACPFLHPSEEQTYRIKPELMNTVVYGRPWDCDLDEQCQHKVSCAFIHQCDFMEKDSVLINADMCDEKREFSDETWDEPVLPLNAQVAMWEKWEDAHVRPTKTRPNEQTESCPDAPVKTSTLPAQAEIHREWVYENRIKQNKTLTDVQKMQCTESGSGLSPKDVQTVQVAMTCEELMAAHVKHVEDEVLMSGAAHVKHIVEYEAVTKAIHPVDRYNEINKHTEDRNKDFHDNDTEDRRESDLEAVGNSLVHQEHHVDDEPTTSLVHQEHLMCDKPTTSLVHQEHHMGDETTTSLVHQENHVGEEPGASLVHQEHHISNEPTTSLVHQEYHMGDEPRTDMYIEVQGDGVCVASGTNEAFFSTRYKITRPSGKRHRDVEEKSTKSDKDEGKLRRGKNKEIRRGKNKEKRQSKKGRKPKEGKYTVKKRTECKTVKQCKSTGDIVKPGTERHEGDTKEQSEKRSMRNIYNSRHYQHKRRQDRKFHQKDRKLEDRFKAMTRKQEYSTDETSEANTGDNSDNQTEHDRSRRYQLHRGVVRRKKERADKDIIVEKRGHEKCDDVKGGKRTGAQRYS